MSSNFLNPVTTQTWANGRHLVRCVKVIQETWDVRTFCFMADHRSCSSSSRASSSPWSWRSTASR